MRAPQGKSDLNITPYLLTLENGDGRSRVTGSSIPLVA
jgi:hypothetical protein